MPSTSSQPRTRACTRAVIAHSALALVALLGLSPHDLDAGPRTAAEPASSAPTLSAEYPSGAWHMMWPISPWSPMAIYLVKLDLSGGVGTFEAFPQSGTAGCDDYSGACPSADGVAFYDGSTLTLEGIAYDGSRTGTFSATGTGTGKIMGMDVWIDNGDGTGHGASTYMRKLAVN